MDGHRSGKRFSRRFQRIARLVPRVLLVLSVLVMASACTRAAPEQALRDAVAQMQAHIQDRDAGGLHGLLDEDFAGPDGMDRRDARRLATAMMLRHRAIGLTSGPLDVQLQGADRATVRATVALTGGSGGLLPDSANSYRVESAWRRRGDDWRLLSLSWTPLL